MFSFASLAETAFCAMISAVWNDVRDDDNVWATVVSSNNVWQEEPISSNSWVEV